jgi:hypothetical protein
MLLGQVQIGEGLDPPSGGGKRYTRKGFLRKLQMGYSGGGLTYLSDKLGGGP